MYNFINENMKFITITMLLCYKKKIIIYSSTIITPFSWPKNEYNEQMFPYYLGSNINENIFALFFPRISLEMKGINQGQKHIYFLMLIANNLNFPIIFH
jgi:hypothetical protein